MTAFDEKKTIAKNTILLYMRMFVNIVISLYTSRIVLKSLGIDDYGIFNVVGSVVSMFSLISGSLSNSVSRFIAFELGKDCKYRLQNIFSMSVHIHIIMAIIILILVELLGVWFLNTRMNIIQERVTAANFVLQFSMLTFVVNLVSVPYNAVIIAHEKMKAFAYISIAEVFMKLFAAILLIVSPYDKLIVYSISLFCIALLLRSVYIIYCRKSFQECLVIRSWDKSIAREIIQFAGWNIFGVFANLLKYQGVNIVLNVFCGSALNAAQGIANQVNNALQSFSDSFIMAINPPIIKKYACSEMDKCLNLVIIGSRFSFYLMLILAFPILFQTSIILDFWLHEYPLYAVSFIRLILLCSLIDVLSKTIVTAINATGKIKAYQLGISFLLFMNFPLSFICLKIGCSPISIYIIAINISIVSLIYRIYILHKLFNFPFFNLVISIILKPIKIFILSIIIGYVFFNVNNNISEIVNTLIAIIMLLASVYVFGLNRSERIYAKRILYKLLHISPKKVA